MKYLVKKAQKGSSTAFVELINLYQQDMYKVARGYMKRDEDIADVIQETILSAYEKIHTLKEPRYFKTWLIRVLLNKCNDMLRKNKELNLFDEMEDTWEGQGLNSNLEFDELVNSIDEKYRVILILYYGEGFNTREISELLEINESTVKTRLIRARDNFAKVYNECMEVN